MLSWIWSRIVAHYCPVSSAEELAQADVVLGQAFGQGSITSYQPGPPNFKQKLEWAYGRANVQLAALASELYDKNGTTSILQWEIAAALPNREGLDEIIKTHREDGKYLDTYEVLSQAAEMFTDAHGRKAVILAHPHHMLRCALVAKKLGFTPLIPDVSHVTYDPESSQVWTRSPWHFIPREIIGLILYKLKGYI